MIYFIHLLFVFFFFTIIFLHPGFLNLKDLLIFLCTFFLIFLLYIFYKWYFHNSFIFTCDLWVSVNATVWYYVVHVAVWTAYDGDCAVMMCSRMGSLQVCSPLPLCVALVILSDSDISVVVALHPLESSFSQTALLTQWRLHAAWGEQNRLCCWEEAYINTCKTISLRHHFHIIVFPQQGEQCLSSEAYQWEQQVRSLEH